MLLERGRTHTHTDMRRSWWGLTIKNETLDPYCCWSGDTHTHTVTQWHTHTLWHTYRAHNDTLKYTHTHTDTPAHTHKYYTRQWLTKPSPPSTTAIQWRRGKLEAYQSNNKNMPVMSCVIAMYFTTKQNIVLDHCHGPGQSVQVGHFKSGWDRVDSRLIAPFFGSSRTKRWADTAGIRPSRSVSGQFGQNELLQAQHASSVRHWITIEWG